MNTIADDTYTIRVQHCWTMNSGTSLSGWVKGNKGPVQSLSVTINGVTRQAKVLTKRDKQSRQKFIVYVPHTQAIPVSFRVESETTARDVVGEVGPTPRHDRPHLPRRDLWPMFLKAVNYRKLSVLEIGARFVDPEAKKKGRRALVEGDYVGFDYYEGPNVDVVGDAHKLSSYFSRQFGAVVSSSVLEHIAMPWLVAIEINRVLELNGLTYHWVPLMWPMHEMPWDFYRFTTGGLQALFSKPLGFQVLDVAYGPEAEVYFQAGPTGNDTVHHHHPLGAAFVSCSIIAKKVANVDLAKTRWDVDLPSVAEGVYPAPKDKK